MRLREIKVGCIGGGTGLPSLLGGLKTNPWLEVNAVVTMFDSGGSSGMLRDQLGVLPPGDILKCALALARNEAEARRVLLARMPTLEHERLAGHTGGNLLLSMMEQYTGDFLAAIDGLRALLGCEGRVWPASVEHSSICAEYADGTRTAGEVEVDALQRAGRQVTRLWLDPPTSLYGQVAEAIRRFQVAIIGPGSFYTSLMPPLLVGGMAEALRAIDGPIILVANLLTEGRGMNGFTAADEVRAIGEAIGRPIDGPIILVANLLTEGRGMNGFTAADEVRAIGEAIGRPIDAVVVNTKMPSAEMLGRYSAEYKHPLEIGDVPSTCEVVEGGFWTGEFARHSRRRLSYALWSVIAQRLLT